LKKKQNSSYLRKIAIKSVILIVLAATVVFIGLVNATFINVPAQKDCPTPRVNVHFVAGSDSQSYPSTYPAATVNVASSYTSASVAFSLFRSTVKSSQPMTYYTDLLRIHNYGSACTINRIALSNIVGARNLGNLTVYLYATQTDSPQTGTPIAYASLTEVSSGTITLLSNAYRLKPSATVYFEVAGYAASTAQNGAIISFTLSMQISPAQSLTYTVMGVGSVLMKHSAGLISGYTGSRTPFTFNLKTADDLLRGDFKLLICHMDKKGHIHLYQAISNSPSTLTVNKHNFPTLAEFNMTVTIRDVTNPHHPITITRNALLQATITQYHNKLDTIAFTITAPSGQLLFSSNWNGAASVEQALWAGTISIH